jgi:hypothetical protein
MHLRSLPSQDRSRQATVVVASPMPLRRSPEAGDEHHTPRFTVGRKYGRPVPPWFNSCRLTVARPGGKLVANDLEAGSRSGEPASDLLKLVGDTGIEPVTSSVSTKRSPTELTALEAEAGIEPAYRALQALA